MADLYPGPITEDEEEIPVQPGLRNLAAMAGEAPAVVPPASRGANQQAPTLPHGMSAPQITGTGEAPVMPLGPGGPSAPDFDADVMSGNVAPPVYHEPKISMGRAIGSGLLSLISPTLGARVAEAPIARAQREYGAEKGQYDTAVSQGLAKEKEASEENLQKAQASEANAHTEALKNPPEKQGLTPEETTIHDLMTGENGDPRVNPQTGKPYTYLEAYGAVKQAAQDTKPEPQKTLTLEEQYDAAVKSGDKTRAQQILDEMKQTSGAKREPKDTSAAAEAANDRSYQFNSTQLEKIRTPIDALATRMSTLTQNANFRTPQADALLAPEILSVVAGGQGSGLRMNQAELDRIVGGATKWTQLQTALNKWSTDPKHATFTDEQRNQMRQIVGAIQAKVSAKQAILEDAEQQLIDAGDKTSQRQVVASTRKLLDAVDNGKKIIRKDGKIQVAQ